VCMLVRVKRVSLGVGGWVSDLNWNGVILGVRGVVRVCVDGTVCELVERKELKEKGNAMFVVCNLVTGKTKGKRRGS